MFLSLMSWGTCIHLFMSPDFLPLMLREARRILVLVPLHRASAFCVVLGTLCPVTRVWVRGRTRFVLPPSGGTVRFAVGSTWLFLVGVSNGSGEEGLTCGPLPVVGS